MVLQHLPQDLAVLQGSPASLSQLGELTVTQLMSHPCPELCSALLCWVMVLLRQLAREQKKGGHKCWECSHQLQATFAAFTVNVFLWLLG